MKGTRSLALAMIVAIVAAGSPGGASAAVTQADLLNCVGQGSAGPREQVAICTRIMKSGKVKPGNQGALLAYRAAAYLALGETKLALADLDKAIASKDTPEFRFQRALVNIARGEAELALADLNTVTRSRSDFAPAYFMRGVIAFRKADYSAAETEFDGAVTRLPTYYQAIYARGVVRSKLGDTAKGEADVTAARGMSAHVEADLTRMGIR
jgi:tetratricopeptide (TPR) repeat protein